MKYHTLFKEIKCFDKNFVLGYKIVDNKIVVSFSNGREYLVPLNEENENKILEKMEEQLQYSICMNNKIKKRLRHSICSGLTNILCIGLNIKDLYLGTIYVPWLSWLGVGLGSLYSVINVFTIIDEIRVIKDIKKNKLFLEEKRIINQNIRNENIKKIVSRKVLNIIESTPEDKPVFDINKIDSISLTELREISDSIHQYLYLGLNENVDIEVDEVKGKSRVLKTNNK